MTQCRAQRTNTGEVRCIPCRRLWDADEVQVCAAEVPLVPTGYVSALAPDLFVDSPHYRRKLST